MELRAELCALLVFDRADQCRARRPGLVMCSRFVDVDVWNIPPELVWGARALPRGGHRYDTRCSAVDGRCAS